MLRPGADRARRDEARGELMRVVRFPGEGHGFRKDETMAVCLQAELDLYASVLGA